MEGIVAPGSSTVEYVHGQVQPGHNPSSPLGNLTPPLHSAQADPGAFKRKHAAMQEAMAANLSRELEDDTATIVKLLHDTQTSEKARTEFITLLRRDAAQMHGNTKNSEALNTTAIIFALNTVLGRQRIAEVVAKSILHLDSTSGCIQLKLDHKSKEDQNKPKPASKRGKEAKESKEQKEAK
tara:strand:- start:470 stop:1015 length:546 start_codon:yes stop_codon:yes gene_type:complete